MESQGTQSIRASRASHGMQAARNPLLRALKRYILNDNPFIEYQSRAVLCVAAAFILLCLPTLAVDLINGNLKLVLISASGGLSMCIAVGAILLYGRSNLAAHITIATLFLMCCALVFARQGVALAFYAGIVSVFFLAGLLLPRRAAIAYSFACGGLVALVAWLSHSHWHTVIDMNDPVIAIGGLRIVLVLIFFNLLAQMVFCDSMHHLHDVVSVQRKEVNRANKVAAKALVEKQAWERLLGRLHSEGQSISWRYDSATGVLEHTTGSGAAGPAMTRIASADRDQLDSQTWQAKILDAIESAGELTLSWARQISHLDRESNEFRWYAVSADVYMAESGGVQVVGSLRDVTGQRDTAALPGEEISVITGSDRNV